MFRKLFAASLPRPPQEMQSRAILSPKNKPRTPSSYPLKGSFAMPTPREKFQEPLKKLFQFDCAALDFGAQRPRCTMAPAPRLRPWTS